MEKELAVTKLYINDKPMESEGDIEFIFPKFKNDYEINPDGSIKWKSNITRSPAKIKWNCPKHGKSFDMALQIMFNAPRAKQEFCATLEFNHSAHRYLIITNIRNVSDCSITDPSPLKMELVGELSPETIAKWGS